MQTPVTFADQYPVEAGQIDQFLACIDTVALVELLAERLHHYASQPGNSLARLDADILDRAAVQMVAAAN